MIKQVLIDLLRTRNVSFKIRPVDAVAMIAALIVLVELYKPL